MLTSTGNIRRPPLDVDSTIFGTPDRRGPFLGPLGEFDASAGATAANLAASQAMIERIDTIVDGATGLALNQTIEVNLGPFTHN